MSETQHNWQHSWKVENPEWSIENLWSLELKIKHFDFIRKFDEEHDYFRVGLDHALICFERPFISHSIPILRLLVDSKEKKQ